MWLQEVSGAGGGSDWTGAGNDENEQDKDDKRKKEKKEKFDCSSGSWLLSRQAGSYQTS
jgi:hypothetical protein